MYPVVYRAYAQNALPYLATIKKLEETSSEAEYKVWSMEVTVLLRAIIGYWFRAEDQLSLAYLEEQSVDYLHSYDIRRYQGECTQIIFLALGRSMMPHFYELTQIDKEPEDCRAAVLWACIEDHMTYEFEQKTVRKHKKKSVKTPAETRSVEVDSAEKLMQKATIDDERSQAKNTLNA